MTGSERIFGMTPWVRRLFVANLMVFLLQLTIFTGPWFIERFGFDPLEAFSRPWVFFTYMFLHGGPLHLAFNLLALFVFGSDVEERMGSRAFIGYYLICGIGGALLSYALALMLRTGVTVGASGAIFGVALAYAWFWPERRLYVFPVPVPVPVRWLIAFLVAFSLILAVLGANDGVAHLAHLGGFAAGFVYLRAQEWRLGRAERRLRRVTEPGVLVHPAARAARGAPTPPRRPDREERDATQAEVDRVLDKISARGMASLTPAERKFLKEFGQKKRSPE
jgi:membrane associated rhomboid family serine protease